MADQDQEAVGRAMAERLKARARETGVDARILQMRFAQERLLTRLQSGEHRDRFVLKGGFLFMCRDEGTRRPTEDVDLHDTTDRGLSDMADAIRQSASMHGGDGVAFDMGSFKVARIREGMRPGVRVTMDAAIGRSVVHVKLDVCSGDAVTPAPVVRNLPAALPKHFAALPVLGYPWETVMAEKMHAMASFGMASTRMKDWFDLATIANEEFVSGEAAVSAVAATFGGRGTPVPSDLVGFGDDFVALKSVDYARWARGMGVSEDRSTLAGAVEQAAALCRPVLEAAASGETLEGDWEPGIGWGGGAAPAP